MVNELCYYRAFKVRLTLKGAFCLQKTEQAFALVIHISVWAEAKHIEATASYSNTVWQDVILPRDTSIEVNKTAPTAEGTLWSHSTTLLLFMSSLRAMRSPSVLLLQTALEIPHFSTKPTRKQMCGQVQAIWEFYGLGKSSQVVWSPGLPWKNHVTQQSPMKWGINKWS